MKEGFINKEEVAGLYVELLNGINEDVAAMSGYVEKIGVYKKNRYKVYIAVMDEKLLAVPMLYNQADGFDTATPGKPVKYSNCFQLGKNGGKKL